MNESSFANYQKKTADNFIDLQIECNPYIYRQ